MDVTAPTDLAGHLDAVRRGWWLVVVCTILGVAAAGAATALLPRTYESTTSVLVLPTGNQDANAAGGRTKETINLDTEAQLVKSTAVGDRARTLLHSPTATGDLIDAVTVAVPPNSTVLQIAYSAGDPALARAGSHAFAEAYLANRADGAASANNATAGALRSQVSSVTKQLQDTSDQIAAATDGSSQKVYLETRRRSLSNQLDTLTGRLSDATAPPASPGRIISDAALPTAPASPSVPVNLAAGFVLGLLVGLAAALLRSRFDRRVRYADDLRHRLGVPVLAELTAAPDGLAAADGERTFSRLRNELTATPGDRAVIAVLGTTAGGAGALVAANLAAAYGRAGTDTVLVASGADGDVAALTGVPAEPGLSDVLAGTDLAEALHRAADEPNLWVLAAGAGAGRPSVEPARTALRRLRERAEQVVLVTPDTATGPDAQTLASLADAAVLAVELRATRREDVRDAVDQLRGVGTPLLGAVVLPPPAPAAATPTAVPAPRTDRDSAPDSGVAEGDSPSDKNSGVSAVGREVRSDEDAAADRDARSDGESGAKDGTAADAGPEPVAVGDGSPAAVRGA